MYVNLINQRADQILTESVGTPQSYTVLKHTSVISNPATAARLPFVHVAERAPRHNLSKVYRGIRLFFEHVTSATVHSPAPC